MNEIIVHANLRYLFLFCCLAAILFSLCSKRFLNTETLTASKSSFVNNSNEDNDGLVNSVKNSNEDNNGLVNHLKRIKSEYILDTPFYVYEELTFPNAILTNKEGKEIEVESFMKEVRLGVGIKHSDDYWFMRSALDHPMRVKDPEKAKLFYIPSLMNLISMCITYRGLNCNYCVWGVCNYDVFEKIDKHIGNSEWFQRNDGADHIIVASHSNFNTIWEKKTKENMISTAFATKFTNDYPNIFKCNKVAFENVFQPNILNQDRINFPSMYVGRICGKSKVKKRFRFLFIANLLKNTKRQKIRDWLDEGTSKNGEFQIEKGSKFKDLINGIHVNHINYCNNIGFGKYGFHVKGDSLGSSRVIDMILNGVVPIFTEQEQYDVLPYWIPFKWLSFFADAESKSLFFDSLKDIVTDEQNKYQIKHDAISEAPELFDYETGVPFDMYMYHFAKEIKENLNTTRSIYKNPTIKNTIPPKKVEEIVKMIKDNINTPLLTVNKKKEKPFSLHVDKYKIYEYEAPEGMRPEDLMKCFRNLYKNIDPTVDSLDFPKEPYLPEDIGTWYLHEQIKDSKYTTKKEEADFMVVNTMPILSAMVEKCNGITHVKRQEIWTDMIKNSELFQKRPQDHLFICQSWACYRDVKPELHLLAYQMTYLIHEANICWIAGRSCSSPVKPKHVIVVPYLGHSYKHPIHIKAWDERKYNVSFIGCLGRVSIIRDVLKRKTVRDLPFLHLVDEGIIDLAGERKKDIATFDRYMDDMINSRFCLILQGDTPSSRRLFDAIITGCIPVFIGPKYSMPFENFIPYDRFSIRIKKDRWLKTPEAQLNSLNKVSVEKGLQMQDEMRKYDKYINWRHGNFVLEGILSNMELKRKGMSQDVKWIDNVGNWNRNVKGLKNFGISTLKHY